MTDVVVNGVHVYIHDYISYSMYSVYDTCIYYENLVHNHEPHYNMYILHIIVFMYILYLVDPN